MTKEVVTCKIKHSQNISKNVLEPSASRIYTVDVNMFYLHVTTSLTYVQHAKTLQMFCNIFANGLAYNICKNIFRGVTCKIKN